MIKFTVSKKYKIVIQRPAYSDQELLVTPDELEQLTKAINTAKKEGDKK